MTKTALITGAGRGIGLGIARALAREGANIAILDVLPEEDVRANLDAVQALGVGVLYMRGDVTRAADRAAVLDAIRARFGGLNILVNNAGVAPKVRADILEATEESFERLMRINLQGPYFLTQAAARWMVEQKRADASVPACIVNISSVSAEVASLNRGEYCLSKAAVSMATRLWAARLGEYDIPVYEIRPGIILTEMTAGVKDKYDRLIAGGLCRQRRWGYPDDIGRAVAALARGDFAYSTGLVVGVDGGMTIQVL